MTRLEALRGLYDAVASGTLPDELVCPTYFENDFNTGYRCIQAYHGSVDDALALIAATLPGAIVHDMTQDGFSRRWWVVVANDTAPHYFHADADNPATALLLACLAALIAIEEGKG
jgi:hypothetical protein